ncbi:MAG: PHP domain-containing protein [Epsilonproteobacteria bacterium]|nr:PHP domain-containing protein [Campylobacterota bacterium]NCO26560.1 PHP domain-containing protein [Campylobacterota bacterium]NCO31085.1 PHP domain-containing protein [Campylobacterota bacterium]NCS69898.1 PHP domain-containing protein [Campylobacterota bacterium]
MKPIDFFPKFNTLDAYSIKVDFHLHSTWTDGKNSVAEIIQSAKKHDLHSIAITDHIRSSSTYFDDYKKEIDFLNAEQELNIYSGFEAKVADFSGNIDVQKEVAKAADIAIVSVHRFPFGRKLYNASEFKRSIAQEMELELNLAALNRGGFNVLGHPGGMSLSFFEEFPTHFYEEIILGCVKNEIAFDLNGRYHNNQIALLYPLLKKHNPFISIGTDSHSTDTMGMWNKALEETI